MSELSSQGQKCHYLMVEATHTGDGRVAMQTVSLGITKQASP